MSTAAQGSVYLGPDWRVVHVGEGFEDGVNFYYEFDEGIVNHALATLHTVLEQRGHPCYCLRLLVGSDNHGYFCRFGNVLTPEHVPKPQIPTDMRIPLEHLVPDYFTWPALAIRRGSLLLAHYGEWLEDFLRRVTWLAQMRLQRGDEYIGYFLLAGLDGAEVPSDRDLKMAAYRTKVEVELVLAHRRVECARTSEEFKGRLRATRTAIEDLCGKNRSAALQHVGDMLTSHLGARWNRAACFCPVDDDTLQCLWAQGGNGTQEWCLDVQRPLGEHVRDVDELVSLVRRRFMVLDDPYFAAVAYPNPLWIGNVSDRANDNILAQLWRARGNIGKLPSAYQEWDLCYTPTSHQDTIDRNAISSWGPVAAVFSQEDPWVRRVGQERPGAPIFVSQNGKYWAFPWWAHQGGTHEKLIGIWVLDMAYWSRGVGEPDFPSLSFTKEILWALGPAMYGYWPNHWGRD